MVSQSARELNVNSSTRIPNDMILMVYVFTRLKGDSRVTDYRLRGYRWNLLPDLKLIT